MKITLALASAAVLSAAALAFPKVAPVGASASPSIGDKAPEFGSSDTKWFNHLGQNPDLAALRGKAVLIEFWATW